MITFGNYFSQVFWEAIGVGENSCVAVLSDRLTGLRSLLSEGGQFFFHNTMFVTKIS